MLKKKFYKLHNVPKIPNIAWSYFLISPWYLTFTENTNVARRGQGTNIAIGEFVRRKTDG